MVLGRQGRGTSSFFEKATETHSVAPAWSAPAEVCAMAAVSSYVSKADEPRLGMGAERVGELPPRGSRASENDSL
eukprot:5897860-Pyramimonas_sp.AAC.1